MNNKKSDTFFKTFGMGLIYTLMFPLIVVSSLIYAFTIIFGWFFVTFKGIFRFFKGDTFYKVLREDKEVALIIQKRKEEMTASQNIQQAPVEVRQPNPQNNVYVQNNYYTQDNVPNTPNTNYLSSNDNAQKLAQNPSNNYLNQGQINQIDGHYVSNEHQQNTNLNNNDETNLNSGDDNYGAY